MCLVHYNSPLYIYNKYTINRIRPLINIAVKHRKMNLYKAAKQAFQLALRHSMWSLFRGLLTFFDLYDLKLIHTIDHYWLIESVTHFKVSTVAHLYLFGTGR